MQRDAPVGVSPIFPPNQCANEHIANNHIKVCLICQSKSFQGINLIYVGLLATESACTFLDVKADRDCKTQIFLGNSPGYHLIDFIN